MTLLRRLWQNHRLLLLVFLATSAIALFFAVRLVAFFIYWADPAHRDQDIAGWMTPGYVSQSWDVPRNVIEEVLGPRTEGKGRRLRDIADARGQTFDQLVTDLKDAIESYRNE